jgi:long-subunit fatty acid transport protein
MKRIIVLLVKAYCLFSVGSLHAQDQTEAQHIALAGTDHFTPRVGYLEQNPATLNQFEGTGIGVQQSLSYGLTALRRNNLSTVFRILHLPFAFDLQGMTWNGNQFYSFAGSTGIRLSEDAALGIKLIVQRKAHAEAKASYSFLPELGMNYTLSTKWKFGFQLRPYINTDQEKDNLGIFRTAISFQIYPKAEVLAGVRVSRADELSQQIALRLTPVKNTAIMLAVNTEEQWLSGGIAYQIQKFHLQMACSYHHQLGMSPCVALNYVW